MKKLMTKVLSFVFVIAMVLVLNPMTAKAEDGTAMDPYTVIEGTSFTVPAGQSLYYQVLAEDNAKLQVTILTENTTCWVAYYNEATSESPYVLDFANANEEYFGYYMGYAWFSVEATDVDAIVKVDVLDAASLPGGSVANAIEFVNYYQSSTIGTDYTYFKYKPEVGKECILSAGMNSNLQIYPVTGENVGDLLGTISMGAPYTVNTSSLTANEEGYYIFAIKKAGLMGNGILNVSVAAPLLPGYSEEDKVNFEADGTYKEVSVTEGVGTNMFYYTYTATGTGKLTFTVNCEESTNGYNLYIADGSWDSHAANPAYQETGFAYPSGTSLMGNETSGTATATYYVEEGETVTIKVSAYDYVTGTIKFKAVYEVAEWPVAQEIESDFTNTKDESEDKLWIVAKPELTVSTNSELPVSGDYATTIYTFTATEAGVYTFSTEDGKLGMWNYAFTDPNPTSGTLELELEANMEVMIGLKDANASTATIKVEKTGDLVVKGQETVVYENTATIKPYTFAGVAANLEFIDFEDGEDTTIVLGTDGYYHLGTATGPVILVNLKATQPLDLADMVNKEQFIAVVIGEEKDVTTNFNTAYAEYVAAADSKTNLYPLTDDLIKIFKEVGKSKGWYLESGWLGDEADAWMFACYYEPETFVNGEGEDGEWTQGTETGYVIHLNININDFKELKINGKVVDPKYYTVKEGSVIITLKPEYLATLEVKAHTVSVVLKDNSTVDTTMTIKAATGTTPTPNPQEPSKGDTINKTGDVANTGIYTVMLLGVAVIAAGAVAKKRYF